MYDTKIRIKAIPANIYRYIPLENIALMQTVVVAKYTHFNTV